MPNKPLYPVNFRLAVLELFPWTNQDLHLQIASHLLLGDPKLEAYLKPEVDASTERNDALKSLHEELMTILEEKRRCKKKSKKKSLK